MHKLILFIKSYRRDFKRAKILINSIEKFNKNHIPLYVSVNDEDFDFFKSNLPSSINLLRDSNIIECKLKDGWRYQQIIKSQVHRLNICENYVCIDSDSEFIKNFYVSDFMYNDNTPYTVMHESKDMLEAMELLNMKSKNAFYKEALRALRNIWGGTGKEWDYGPSPFIWSTKVWKHLENNYLIPNNFTFESFLLFLETRGTVPSSEYTIYGEYLFQNQIIDIIPVQPLFKVYHFPEQYEMERSFKTIDKLKENYLGLIKQSNWEERKRRLKFSRRVKLKMINYLIKKL